MLTIVPGRIDFVGSSLTECKLGGTFCCIKKYQRKARERELLIATFVENRRAAEMLNPTRNHNVGTYRGGEGTTCVTTACPDDC